MVLPTRPLLTFSLAIWRLSFSARAPLSLAQYGVTAPFNPTHAFTRRGIEEMIRFSAAPRFSTSEKWGGHRANTIGQKSC